MYLYAFGMLAGHYLGMVYRGMIRFYEMWWRWLFFHCGFLYLDSSDIVSYKNFIHFLLTNISIIQGK